MRILTDNPGDTFTRNFDQKFVDTARGLLKASRDPSVRQILMETLDDMERTKGDDENLTLIISMWKKEKEKAMENGVCAQPLHAAKPCPVAKTNLLQGRAPPGQMMPPPMPPQQPVYNPHSQNYFARSHSNKRMPDPVELSSRLEEARTSAKLLEQVVMNTTPTEMLSSDLIKEFADRCQSASRSIQGYMTSENPAPDNETMEHLIDTNELLQTALNQHKRAVLNSRKHLGLGQRTSTDTPVSFNHSEAGDHRDDQTSIAPSHDVPVSNLSSPVSHMGKGKETDFPSPVGPPPSALASGSGYNSSKPLPDSPSDDHLADPHHVGSSSHAGPSANGEFSDSNRLAYEPFHPGFGTTPNLDLKTHGRQRDEVSDDEDLYSAPPPKTNEPKTTEPMYRY